MSDLALLPEAMAPRSVRAGRALVELTRRSLAAEAERWVLWTPVALAVGIGLYYELPNEPPVWSGCLGVGCAGFMVLFIRRRFTAGVAWAVPLLAGLGIVAAGFAAAQIETRRAAAPTIDRPLGMVSVQGTVVEVEERDKGTRVLLEPSHIAGIRRLPRFVRFTLRDWMAQPAPGDGFDGKVSLMPPDGPAIPGGFDFQRQAWFNGIGAVGYAVGHPQVRPGRTSGTGAFIADLRSRMTARIRASLPGTSGGVAAALITGKRGAIPPETANDYRNAGLAHLLVIAGLHMSLVTGFVFFFVRAVLAAIPALALRRPIKKWAAAAALAVAACYLLISGAAVPTERAFVMVGLVLLAVIADRVNLSMRAVALAASMILLIDPFALTGVSFQMSFAAVVALVSVYETYGARLRRLRIGPSLLASPVSHAIGIATTTLVATLGTAAFTIYHFNRFAVFSVLGNLLAMPVAAFWVMPLAFFSCLLMPLGLEALTLVPMGWGIDLITGLAHWTAGLPDAVVALRGPPDWGLILFAAGGLWLTLWRTRWRRLGIVPLILGCFSSAATTPPDILVSSSGELIALRTPSGYLLSSDRRDRWDAETWLRDAAEPAGAPLPASGEAAGGIRCDPTGCIWQTPQGIVALSYDIATLEEDCRRAILVVATIPTTPDCRRSTLVVDRSSLRREGTTAVWLSDGVRIDTAAAHRGHRPWVLEPHAYAPRVAGRINSGAATRPADPAP